MILSVRMSLLARFVRVVEEPVRFRQVNARRTPRKKREPSNPGAELQVELFGDSQSAELEETDFEETESDFMNVDVAHRVHEEQMHLRKERDRYLLVRQKYFKEKVPNFLTWSDKQQMRYLHSNNPDEWTVEKLSEGFPALPETVAKVVRGTWTKNNQAKIKNHDASVQSNWNLFQEGKIPDLPPVLVEHLNKFTHRQLSFEPLEIYESNTNPGKKKKVVEGEFSEIITSYKRIKEKDCQKDDDKSTADAIDDSRKPLMETYVAERYKHKGNVTLKQLQEKLEEKVCVGKELKEEEKFLLKKLQDTREALAPPPVESQNAIVDISDSSYAKTGVVSMQSRKDYAHLTYPQKINIPKGKWRRGFTYKLNDCFYDCDGLFLYRVPGMDK